MILTKFLFVGSLDWGFGWILENPGCCFVFCGIFLLLVWVSSSLIQDELRPDHPSIKRMIDEFRRRRTW